MAEPRPDVTILIFEALTGGGRLGRPIPRALAREGVAMRRALVADFAAVPGVRVVEPVDARFLDDGPADATRIVGRGPAPIDLDPLIHAADAVVLVAPETGGELAALAERVERAGGHSLGATPAAIRLCGDKLALAEHLARLGIPTPPTRAFEVADGMPRIDSPSGRVVIKPVDGAGAADTFVLNADGELPAILENGRMLVQPYRPGPAFGATFLVGRDGRAHLVAVGRQAIAIGADGAIRYEGGEVPSPCEADLDPARRAVESVPGLAGLVGVDFVATGPGEAVAVIEINPRATTSIVGLARLAPAGTIARAWLDLLGPDPADPGPDFAAIRRARPVRFAADGTTLGPPEATR